MMSRYRRVVRHGWSAAVLLLLSSGLAAQNAISPELEYKKLLKVNEEIQPLGENPFGENISLYNGNLSFSQTDISLAGTGPLLQLTRSFRITGKQDTDGYFNGAFGEWNLDLPRITTVVATQQNVQGWLVDGSSPKAICTQIGIPPVVLKPSGITSRLNWAPHEWWHGYQLVLPSGESQDILGRRQGGFTQTPQMPGLTFTALTKKHWMIGCLPQAANDTTREAFLAISPDGTKYTFDYLDYSTAPTVNRPVGTVEPLLARSQSIQPMMAVEDDFLYRDYAAMLVTKIEDRFGNWLQYSYNNGRLTGVTASDGREVVLQYNSNATVASITVQPNSGAPRTWSYSYGTFPATGQVMLTGITQPDQSHWAFAMGSLKFQPDLTPTVLGDCNGPGVVDPNSWSGSMTHPSGLVGTFTIATVRHGRSYTPKGCWGGDGTTYDSGFALIPRAWYSFTIASKTFSGAGLTSPQIWSYQYSPANDSWTSACTNNSCPSTVWTDVTAPDGKAERFTFSNMYGISEGRLSSKDSYTGDTNSAIVRSETDVYAEPDNNPWPLLYGNDFLGGRSNYFVTSQEAPLLRKVITQDSDTYTWEAQSFNAYAQVTRSKQWSSAAAACYLTPTTAQPASCYTDIQHDILNDTALWVLGLPLSTTNVTSGEVIDSYLYDSRDTLQKRDHFGQTVVTYAFNAQGQLASFTDAKTRTTSLGSYKRGIPQLITYPDSTTQSLVVDDLGQISSITDQAGSTTSYTYDAVGRIASISYPSGDEQAWLPKTFTYEFVTGAERGIAANHWRRTVSKGASRAVTYFDTYLRPILADTYINGVGGSFSSARTDYDWKGQKTFQSYPVGSAANLGDFSAGVRTQYDAIGRAIASTQTSELGNLTSTTTYLSGARKQVTDPKNNVTATRYLVFDTPSFDTVIGVQAPEGVNQEIVRDVYGNPRSITQWGTNASPVIKQLYYDSYYRLCRTKEPESGSEVTAYDAVNNVLWTAAGQSIGGEACGQELVAEGAKTYRDYNVMNRVEALRPPAGTPATAYTYDALGNVATANTGISSWSGARNKLGMLTSEQLGVVGNGINVIGYSHDAYGSIQTISYPDATVVDYAPDALGRPTKAGSYASGVTYYPDGDIASFTFGNGVSYTVEKNARQLLSNFSYGTASKLDLSQDYAYDANGNITSITDLANAGQRSKSMTYDNLNRLTSATSGLWNGTESYSYDAINNIRSRTLGGAIATYNYDSSNRLASITGGSAPMTLGYDARGNVIVKNDHALVFNDKNQLTSIPGFGSYDYDASGRRVRKVKPGGDTSYYFYTQGGQLLYAMDTATAKVTSYIYLGKKMIARNETLQLAASSSISADISPNNGTYTVSWTPSPGATSYVLDESADNGASWNNLGSAITATSYAISNKAGGGYLYRVKSCAGTQCIGYTTSPVVGVTPALPGISVPGAALVGSYPVGWTASTSATSYDVQEQINGGNWSTIAGDIAALTINRPGTSSGSYKYQVRAKNAYGDRGWVVSSTVTVDTTLGDPPSAPANITVPTTSYDGNVTVSWSSAVRATRYVVTQSPGNSTVYDGANTSVALSSLTSGTYSFAVKACSDIGCSSATISGNLVVTRAPTTAPTLTAPANNTNGSYTINWTSISSATSYTLQESINGGAWTQVQANSATSWAASSKTNGSYAYRVQGCNVGGCGGWSATGTTTVLLPPPTPTGLGAPAAAYGAFTVSWNATPTATGYDLYQTFNSGAWVLVYRGSATSMTITPSASGTYGYSLYATNASGISAQPIQTSSPTTVTLAPTATPSLSAPASNNTGSYAVSWTTVSGANSYTLQEQVNGGAWGNVQVGAGTSWTASGKATGSYGYRAQACNAGGCGPWSNTGSTAVALIPAAPTGGVTRYTVNSKMEGYRAEWSSVPGATYYQVQRVYDGFLWYQGPGNSVVIVEGERPIDPEEIFDVRVRACNAIGCSGWVNL